MLDVLLYKRGGLVVSLSCERPASLRRRPTLCPNWMSVELRLGITVMLCHFARFSSVDYRLQDEKAVEGPEPRVEGRKSEFGDGRWKRREPKGQRLEDGGRRAEVTRLRFASPRQGRENQR